MALIPTIITFTPNTPILAAEANSNNNAFKNGVNNLDDRLVLVESGNTTLSGSKIFSGTVSFSSSPPVCAVTPTINNHLVNKTYADALVTGLDLNNLTGPLAINKGGTGQITANASLNALLPSQTGNNGKFLKTGGTNSTWELVTKSDVGLSNVENTALTTWTGSGNLTTAGNLTCNQLNVAVGNLVVDTGNLNITTGGITAQGASGSIRCSKNITTDTGNVVVSTGNISVAVGNIQVDTGNVTLLTGKVTAPGVINNNNDLVNRGYVTQNGITSARPVSPVNGQFYLDLTINKPIWWNGSNWIDATGTTV